ncbi:MAG: 23S rRNA (guanosine(2251)-2'-O)-methyltransferase RlmB [Pyrinomonadaceae bacterium]|nr:23S rRNA (guanosine(2251)-2'-O)-methyltransferase RlmB [Pyrinomonadaceae bacterium]
MAARMRKRKPENPRKTAKPSADRETRLIYGVMPVLESLRAGGGKMRKIVMSEGRRDSRSGEIDKIARKCGVPVIRISRKEFDALFEREVNHQGVAAYVKTVQFKSAESILEKAEDNDTALFLVIDGIEDPRNLGAILRTAECAGVDGVFIPERRNAGITDTAVKTSAGASEILDIAKVKNQNRLIDELKSRDVWVVGASGDSETVYSDWDFDQKTAIVVGREGKGLHRLTAEKCDILVGIPMLGNIDSLNVSVAAGVLLYEVVRQRGTK